tara:strand:- start:7013 stop:9400 length:2388 start_codon:yes stop_codon:yes gene_type:complete
VEKKMAEEKSPYDNIDKEFTLVNRPFEPELGDNIEVELPTETVVNEDGSVDVGPEDELKPEMGFGSNLVQALSEDDLAGISSMVLEKVDEDKSARQEWINTYIKGLELLGVKYENRTEPFQGATGVIHPMLNEAVSQFQSQAYKELLPPSGPVRTQVVGDITPELEKQAERVKDYMNYEIIHTMEEYDAEFDQMLYYLGLCGSAFKKVYRDPQLARQVSKFVQAEDLLVPYNATDLNSAERVTHIIKMSPNDLRKLQVSGFYDDVDIKGGDGDQSDLDYTKEELTGVEKVGSYEEITLYETHCYLDLEDFPDVDAENEPTGIKLPYIVTVSADSGDVLSVYRNYDGNDMQKRKKQFFVHYMFTPGLGFYGNGLIHLLGNLSRTATANLRQLVDAGTLANMPAGFKSRGLRIRDDDQPLQPGEWRDVDVIGTELRSSLLPLPYKEPSATLFQLLGFVVQAAQKFVGTTDIGTGNIQNTEMPVGTTIALLERGSRIMSAVHKRLYNAMKQEFKLMSDIIALDPSDYPYNINGAQPGMKQADFDGRVDIIPVANPNIFSMSQRVSLAQEQLKLATAKPDIHNVYEAYRRMYNALNVDNVEQILPPPAQPQPMNPVQENGILQMALVGRQQLKAFPDQNHDAHISAHLNYMTSNVMRGNPAMMQVLQTHIFEHIGMKAQMMVQQEMQMQEGQGQIEPSLLASRVAEVEAELQNAYLQQENEVLGALGKDPLVDLKKQELALRQQEQQQDAQQDQAENMLDQMKIDQQAQLARERISSTEDIANMRAQIALQRTANRGGN